MAIGKTLGKPFGKTQAKGLSGKSPRTTRAAPSAPDAPLKAMSLLGRWGKVSQGHVAFGGGCSCGGGMGPVHMSEMEMHVMDYLAAKYAGNAAIQALLVGRGGYKAGESGNLGEVLKAMAMRDASEVLLEDQLSMLADLERSIESLDEITRRG